MAGRFSAFGIPVWECDTSDVLEIGSAAREAVLHTRSGAGPASLILHTYRFSAHSKGDDPRSPEELARIRMFDPLTIHGSRLSARELEKAEKDVTTVVEDAFIRADMDPFPSLPVEGQTSDFRLSTFDMP